MSSELPGKKVTNIGDHSIVLTSGSISMPQPLQKLNSNISPNILGRMRSPSCPINPSQSPIRIPLPKLNADQCRQVMLITVTLRIAVLLEHGEITAVGDYLEREGAVDLEPLGAFSPLGEFDEGLHFGVVSSASYVAREIIGLHESFGGIHEVGVDGGEVEERNAGF